MSRCGWAATAAASAGAVGVFFAAGGTALIFSSPFVTACEGALARILADPQSYQRVEVAERVDPLASPAQGFRHSATIRFYTNNRSGSVDRGRVECTYDSAERDPGEVDPHAVAINGKTLAERASGEAGQGEGL